jgi:hypothetical protein
MIYALPFFVCLLYKVSLWVYMHMHTCCVCVCGACVRACACMHIHLQLQMRVHVYVDVYAYRCVQTVCGTNSCMCMCVCCEHTQGTAKHTLISFNQFSHTQHTHTQTHTHTHRAQQSTRGDAKRSARSCRQRQRPRQGYTRYICDSDPDSDKSASACAVRGSHRGLRACEQIRTGCKRRGLSGQIEG